MSYFTGVMRAVKVCENLFIFFANVFARSGGLRKIGALIWYQKHHFDGWIQKNLKINSHKDSKDKECMFSKSTYMGDNPPLLAKTFAKNINGFLPTLTAQDLMVWNMIKYETI